MIERIEDLVRAVVALEPAAARAAIDGALAGRSPRQVADELVRPALEEIGALWERGEVSLAHLYVGSRICEHALADRLDDADHANPGDARVAIGVFEDQHALGKRIVLASLRASGFAVKDYGSGLQIADVLERVGRDRIDVLLLSTLMLRSALRITELAAALRSTHPGVRLVVGGAPFRLDPRLGAEVGAHAWGASAGDAVRIVGELVGRAPPPSGPEALQP